MWYVKLTIIIYIIVMIPMMAACVVLACIRKTDKDRKDNKGNN